MRETTADAAALGAVPVSPLNEPHVFAVADDLRERFQRLSGNDAAMAAGAIPARAQPSGGEEVECQ
jgi:hypothetical protein